MSVSAKTAHKLAGRAELRKLLGVSATRSVQIAAQPDFPEPLDVLTMGAVWSLDDVIAWAARKGRALHLDVLSPDVKALDKSSP